MRKLLDRMVRSPFLIIDITEVLDIMNNHDYPLGGSFEKVRGRRALFFAVLLVCAACILEYGIVRNESRAGEGPVTVEQPVTTHSYIHEKQDEIDDLRDEVVRLRNLPTLCRNMAQAGKRELVEIQAKWEWIMADADGVKMERRHVPRVVLRELEAEEFASAEKWKRLLAESGCYDLRWDL